MDTLVVSIVSYKSNILEISKVLSFVKKLKNLKVKVCVFDNAKQNSLLKFCKFNKFDYFASKNNIGFGNGHNFNVKKTIKLNPFYLILNPDIHLKAKDVKKCINLLKKRKKYGLLAPKLINTDGSTQLICRKIPNLIDFFSRFFLKVDYYSTQLHKKIDKAKKIKFILNIPFIHGACYFIKPHVIKKVGCYDKNFFMYVEDLDLYRRVTQKFDTIYYKTIKVVHLHKRDSHKSIKLFLLHLKSILYYFHKWGIFFDKDRKIANNKIYKKFNI